MKTIINLCVSAGGRSGIQVEFSSISFYFRSYGDLSYVEMDRVCQFLHNRVQNQERTQLYQLTACFKAFKRYSDTVKLKILPSKLNVSKPWKRLCLKLNSCIFLCMCICITLCPVLQCCISPCVILRWWFGWESQPPPKKPSFWVLWQEAGPKPNARTFGRWGAQQI